MKFKKTLTAIALSSAVSLSAIALLSPIISCFDFAKRYETGTVEKKSVTPVSIVPSTGAVFGNDSVKFGEQACVLDVETPNGIYTMSVYQQPYGNRRLEGVDSVIKPGTRVKFVKDAFFGFYSNFNSDKIGKLSTGEIEVLGR